MGGRGSCYLNFYDPSNATSGDVNIADILEDILEDEDTKKEYNGKTKKLKEKKIHIKQSTDDMPEDMFIPNITKVDSLTRKYVDTVGTLKNENETLDIRANKLSPNTTACFIHDGTRFNNLHIVFNNDLKLSSKELVEGEAKRQIDSGFWMNVDKNEYVNQTITHEYGHFVQKVLMQRELTNREGKMKYEAFLTDLAKAKSKADRQKRVQEYAESYATKYFKSIQRIHRKYFGKEGVDMISNYGKTNNREAFAELFAGLNCCKKPSSICKATEIFLSKKMNVKNFELKTMVG